MTNLISNPWYNVECVASKAGWDEITPSPLGWANVKKKSQPGPVPNPCAPYGFAVKWASNMRVPGNTWAYIYQDVDASGSQLHFSAHYVMLPPAEAKVEIYGEGPSGWELVWSPLHVTQQAGPAFQYMEANFQAPQVYSRWRVQLAAVHYDPPGVYAASGAKFTGIDFQVS